MVSVLREGLSTLLCNQSRETHFDVQLVLSHPARYDNSLRHRHVLVTVTVTVIVTVNVTVMC